MLLHFVLYLHLLSSTLISHVTVVLLHLGHSTHLSLFSEIYAVGFSQDVITHLPFLNSTVAAPAAFNFCIYSFEHSACCICVQPFTTNLISPFVPGLMVYGISISTPFKVHPSNLYPLLVGIQLTVVATLYV